VDLELTGKTVLITGGSRGIGFTLASLLLDEGASVALCARDEQRLARSAEVLREKGTVHYQALDVADAAAAERFVEDSAAALGGIDGVVVNASAGATRGTNGWHQSFQTDLMSLVHLLRSAGGHLRSSDAASVVYVATTSALEFGTVPTDNSYSALKAAGLQHALAQSHTLASDGVRVNAISPGPVEHPGGDWESIKTHAPDLYEATVASTGLGRLARTEDIAAAAAFLLSPVAGHITGVNLVVDGGYTNRFSY